MVRTMMMTGVTAHEHMSLKTSVGPHARTCMRGPSRVEISRLGDHQNEQSPPQHKKHPPTSTSSWPQPGSGGTCRSSFNSRYIKVNDQQNGHLTRPSKQKTNNTTYPNGHGNLHSQARWIALKNPFPMIYNMWWCLMDTELHRPNATWMAQMAQTQNSGKQETINGMSYTPPKTMISGSLKSPKKRVLIVYNMQWCSKGWAAAQPQWHTHEIDDSLSLSNIQEFIKTQQIDETRIFVGNSYPDHFISKVT